MPNKASVNDSQAQSDQKVLMLVIIGTFTAVLLSTAFKYYDGYVKKEKEEDETPPPDNSGDDKTEKSDLARWMIIMMAFVATAVIFVAANVYR